MSRVKLFEFQETALKMVNDRNRCAFFLDM